LCDRDCVKASAAERARSGWYLLAGRACESAAGAPPSIAFARLESGLPEPLRLAVLGADHGGRLRAHVTAAKTRRLFEGSYENKGLDEV